MRTGAIEIIGITPDYDAPDCKSHCYTQMCETDKLTIACSDPEIEDIIRVSLNVKVRRFRVICTSLGRKLVVYANKEIELVVNSSGVSYHSRFSIPFCSFILLNNDGESVIEPRVIVEDIDVTPVSPRCIAVSSLLFVFPILRTKTSCHNHNPSEICCDIEIRPCSSTPDRKYMSGRVPFLLGSQLDSHSNK